MPLAAIEAYLQELPALVAEWQLRLGAVIELPYLSDKQRRKTIRSWEEDMALEYTRPQIAPPPRLLALVGIQVVTVTGNRNR